MELLTDRQAVLHLLDLLDDRVAMGNRVRVSDEVLRSDKKELWRRADISAEPKRTPAGFRTPSDRPKTVTPFVKLCTSTQSPWVQTAGFFCGKAS